MALISKEKAISKIEQYSRQSCSIYVKTAIKLIDETPTVESVPREEAEKLYKEFYEQGRFDAEMESRPKGVWVGIDEEPHEEWECSYCGNIINTYMQDELEEYKYCHKCGAKMSTPWADMGGEEE